MSNIQLISTEKPNDKKAKWEGKELGFHDINFGLADGYQEMSHQPYLLEKGFLDSYNWIDSLINGPKFLILGTKGSGKTAIGAKIKQISEKDDSLKVQFYFLSNFPFQYFSGFVTSREAKETRFVDNWYYLLLIAFFNSINNDDKMGSVDLAEKDAILEVLKKIGYIPSTDLSRIVEVDKEIKIKGGIPKIIEGERTITDNNGRIKYQILLEWLKIAAMNITGTKRHFIIIDGLDDVLTKREGQYESLSALIVTAHRLNMEFRFKKVPWKIILLCRSDLFEKLRNPNKNKIIQDCGIELQWHFNFKEIYRSDLVNLANLRAKISLCEDINIFEKYLPKKVYRKDNTTAFTILSHTRNIPRDFIHLLKYIQNNTSSDKLITNIDIQEAIEIYSEDYMVREIKDELTGFLEDDEISSLFDLLMSINKSEFTYKELKCVSESEKYNKLELDKALFWLFMCGGIGNVTDVGKGKKKYSFKYRNKHAKLDIDKKLIVDSSLKYGLNLT